MDRTMVCALTVILGGLLLAGEVDTGQAHRQANARTDAATVKGSDFIGQRPYAQMTNVGELRPVVSTGRGLSVGRSGDEPTGITNTGLRRTVGACCDPYTGICTDNVEIADCLSPLQFGYETLCAELVPPCGNPGACCDDYGDACTDGVLELNCTGTRFAPLPATCADFTPACGDLDFTFVFDPGSGPPPDILCGCPMTPFPDDPRPTLQDVSDVPSPCPTGGDVEFSIPLGHRRIGSGWSTWSHGYTGDVYYTNGATEVTLTLPPASCGFYFYVEPNGGYASFKVIVNGVIESPEFWAYWASDAAFVGVCGEGLQTIEIISISGHDFAIGEFGICCFCCCAYGACCDPYAGDCTDDVEVMDCLPPLQWTWETPCAELDPPCGTEVGACCVGPEGEPPWDPYECIGDMTTTECLAAGEDTFWVEDESCEASPPYDCGAPTYCEGAGGCDEFISNVYVVHDAGTIDNSSACSGYADYTDLVALMTLGLSYDLTVTNGNYYGSDVTAVWIDWNQDKDWDDDGETIWMYDPGGAVASGPIDVPPTAIPGYTRMRIRIDYANPTPDPCGTTTYGEVEDYTVLVSGDMPTGACCDPFTGVCTDGVEAVSCLSPLQFGHETLCTDLSPPCGNPGACCDDFEDACTDGVLQLNCSGTRFAPLPATCADFTPACGQTQFIFVFDPGTGPPPDTLCGCPMTPFPDDPRPTLQDVTDVPSPCPIPDDIGFSIPMSHRKIGDGWVSWSHGYTGDVYYTNGVTEVTITLPPASHEFYFYVEPNPYGLHTFKLTANGIFVSEEFTAEGSSGAAYAGVCGSGLDTIKIECTSGVDFAIGELGICCFSCCTYGACCDPYTGTCTDDVEVMQCVPPLQWRYETACADLDPPCGNQGCCCDEDTGVATEEFEANCQGRFLGGVTGVDCTPEAFDPPCGEWVPTGVLYCPAMPDNPTFRAGLSTALWDWPVDYFDARVGTPTLELLAEYAAVFTWVNYAYADNVAMGNVLADYVDTSSPCNRRSRVILGQWCLPTAGNYLSGRIMTEGYCPATATSYSSDSYAGNGWGCPTMWVDSFSSSYFDQTTTLPWAVSDGTTLNGYDFVSMNPARSVWYSPGNTSTMYSSGDVVELTANMVLCTAGCMYGACCNLETGECVECVEIMDCLDMFETPQFSYEQQCAELDPPCGNPGACCDDDTGACTIEYEANCPGRFVAGGVCDPNPFSPPCGEPTGCILYAPSHPDNPTWRAQVAALCGCNVDYWDTRVSTPTLEDLLDYDGVFTWANYAYADAILFGDTLAAYVDAGGRVILGQWTFDAFSGTPGPGGSVIVEPEYCPVTVTSWSSGTYAGDGTDCVHILGPVSEYAASYCDQALPRPGAVTDGTFVESGLPAVIWRADRRVYYSPGNTGGDYTAGDTAQLVANMYSCTNDPLTGACCHPTDGACTNGVAAADCVPPLEFHYQETCETLDPPCGNSGCCCDDDTATRTEEFEVNCAGRFLPGVLGTDCLDVEPFDPPCGEHHPCQHAITMWDDYGDGWNGGWIDVYINGDMVVGGVSLADGFGPATVLFEAAIDDEIATVWTPGGWPYEASYCLYDGRGQELGCDGMGGVEPTGITVLGDCELVMFARLDIKPGSCPNPFNRNSHGVLPVAFIGTEDFALADVDVDSIRLSRADGVGGEVAPNEGPPGPHSVFEDVATPFEGEPCDCHDLSTDGIDDLSVKFRADDVVEALELDDLDSGTLVELVVTGNLLDGTPFEAGDCIRLVPPGTSPGLLTVVSNVAGAWIDVSPLDDTLDGGGFADFERSYPQTTVVTLTAEETFGGRTFTRWVVDGVPQPVGVLTVQVTIDGVGRNLAANYRQPTKPGHQLDDHVPTTGGEG